MKILVHTNMSEVKGEGVVVVGIVMKGKNKNHFSVVAVTFLMIQR